MPRLVDHRERREQLAEAAWRVIVREGVAGASVRNVAAEAGLSVGSLRHFFTTQSELLVFCLQLVIDRVADRVAALPAQPTPQEAITSMAEQFLPLDADRRAEMEVYLSLFSAGREDDVLRVCCQRAYRLLREACLEMIMESCGPSITDDPRRRDFEAARLHAVIDGLALHLLYEPAGADPRWAQDVLDTHVRGLVE